MFNPIYSHIMYLILNLIFSLFPCSGGLVLFGSLEWKVLSNVIETIIIYCSRIEYSCPETEKTYNVG